MQNERKCSPALIPVALSRLANADFFSQGAFSRLDPTGQFKDELLLQLPTGRLGEINELANLAAYLVSDYSSWLTGEVRSMLPKQNFPSRFSVVLRKSARKAL